MDYFLGSMAGDKLERKADAPLGVCGITHDCPFCGQRASQGRVLNWIAGECILAGEAVFPCSHCGRMISIPASIFVEASLKKLRQRCFNEADGQLNQRTLFMLITGMSARELLVPDWGEVILARNK